MTKIIFLDIDGVICTHRAHVGQNSSAIPMEAFDREGVGLLNALVRYAPDTKFVLSSSWRQHFTQVEMEERLIAAGWTGRFHEDWKTKKLLPQKMSMSVQRGDEVAEWLNRHPDIDTYVILDDNSDFADDQPLVLTDAFNGFMYEHYARAKRILLKEPEPKKAYGVLLP